ncbi:unnamed protein product [Caenorhabditis angaria]|uniref:Uncharacterized protein n=1 Tax=Caenorhabditis angaria TaxID=860376 RepID=A0A9P1MVN6_9PELO|nr:unnamed protein product [Caenorhabditis angaria]
MRLYNYVLASFLIFGGNVRCEDDMELVLVQAIWRHGERAALADLYPIYEKDWIFGGGGFGELTATGMGHMFQLGQTLREKYSNFISPRYDSKEVYIRSTDINRTIISAMSVAYGLYQNQNDSIKRAGIDYPDIPGWNPGFNFVPIHVDSSIDNYLTNARPNCPRFNQLNILMQKLPEYQIWAENFNNYTTYFYGLYNLSSTDTDALFSFDSLKCQSKTFNSTLYQKCPWYNLDFFEENQRIIGPYKGFVEGYFKNPAVLNGIDIAKEVQILQGGPLFSDVYDRMKSKIDCITSEKCDGFFKNLKFYGFSLHDQNVYSQLVNFGFPEITESLEYWPSYSATILYETYRSKNSTFFKLLFKKSYNSGVSDVTRKIKGCEDSEYCPISILTSLVDQFRPTPDIKTLCFKDLTSSSFSSTYPTGVSLIIFAISLIFYN